MRELPSFLNSFCVRSQGATLLAVLVSLIAFMPVSSDAASDQKEPLDLSILEREAEITPQLPFSQRLQVARIKEAIKKARSDLRSGQFMIEAEYTAMQPMRDVKGIQDEGKRLIAEAEATIYENQKALIELLQGFEEAKTIFRSVDESMLGLELRTEPPQQALQIAFKSVMTAAWGQSYEFLFFHEIFIQDPADIRVAGSEIRNQVYDVLVALDGTNFSLVMPVDFKLKPDTDGSQETTFSYQNADSFAKNRKALLAIKLIVPKDSLTGLLSVSAIDMKTHRIVAAELVKIDDITELLAIEATEERSDQILERVELRGGAENIRRVAKLPEPYRFQLVSNTEDTQIEALITQTILKNSELLLVGSSFIMEAYGESLSEPEAWQGQANGRVVVAADDSENTFVVGLQIRESPRTLPAGEVTIFPSVSK